MDRGVATWTRSTVPLELLRIGDLHSPKLGIVRGEEQTVLQLERSGQMHLVVKRPAEEFGKDCRHPLDHFIALLNVAIEEQQGFTPTSTMGYLHTIRQWHHFSLMAMEPSTRQEMGVRDVGMFLTVRRLIIQAPTVW
jgi:hypothetical protein